MQLETLLQGEKEELKMLFLSCENLCYIAFYIVKKRRVGVVRLRTDITVFILETVFILDRYDGKSNTRERKIRLSLLRVYGIESGGNVILFSAMVDR